MNWSGIVTGESHQAAHGMKPMHELVREFAMGESHRAAGGIKVMHELVAFYDW